MTRGPRILLRQIREALGAGAAPAQDRLDMVVPIIARSMVAEVCSIYLRRAGGDLELFATEGLSRDAVHVTRLKPAYVKPKDPVNPNRMIQRRPGELLPGAGNPGPAYPRLAGQQSAYLVRRLQDYRAGNAPVDDPLYKIMAAIAKPLTDAEIQSLASYLQGLHTAPAAGKIKASQ